MPQPSITEIIWKIKYLKFHLNFAGFNELTILYYVITACIPLLQQMGGREQPEEVDGTEKILTDLDKYTRYFFRVVALNRNGQGVSSEEVSARTFSDGKLSSYHMLIWDGVMKGSSTVAAVLLLIIFL